MVVLGGEGAGVLGVPVLFAGVFYSSNFGLPHLASHSKPCLARLDSNVSCPNRWW